MTASVFFAQRDHPQTLQDKAIRIVHDIIDTFTLNPEQERAFILVAEGLHHRDRPPLRMYLGGMGGTGKTMVFHAISEFLRRRDEAHRFLIMAPTGSASAQADGSTYHSVLGFTRQGGPQQGTSKTTLMKVRERIEPADVHLLDEISMVSPNEIYKISAQESLALDVPDYSFGGRSVIFAGDFGQLPPPGPGQAPLYSPTIGPWSEGLTVHSQQSIIGKALWHTFTTVVILRRNMRQKGQTEGDARLRTTLENVRLKRCTAADFALLDSRTVGKGLPADILSQPHIRNVSIITARNAHRDAINCAGATRFALETGQQLINFYSTDSWSSSTVPQSDSVRQTQRFNETIDKVALPVQSHSSSKGLQHVLWNLTPTATDHCPGILSLCMEMPIMLKYNYATELCATNGAEGIVVGWDSHKDSQMNQDVLDTLFVKLTSPPRAIQIEGLPPNVIPLTRSKESIQCMLPNDFRLHVERTQVRVLLNFAMSDYASQGRTRVVNVVHVSYCRGHQSIYTCLSRCATLEETYIIGDIDRSKLTGGLSGALRREFRELEILDDITRLRCEGTLDSSVTGTTRAELIDSYQKWKGMRFVPPHVPDALNWSAEPLDNLKPPLAPPEWHILVPRSSQKRKHKDTKDTHKHVKDPQKVQKPHKKRSRLDTEPVHEIAQVVESPQLFHAVGFKWDNMNWSCAYDSLFTILYNIFCECPTHTVFNANPILHTLRAQFASVKDNMSLLEHARDQARASLHALSLEGCPLYGPTPSVLSDVVLYALRVQTSIGTVQTVCSTCDTLAVNSELCDTLWSIYPFSWDHLPQKPSTISTADCVELYVSKQRGRRCTTCGHHQQYQNVLTSPPQIVAIEVFPDAPGFPSIIASKHISVPVNGVQTGLRFAGVIYAGSNHFTARYIATNYTSWYHDGISTGRDCIEEGYFENVDSAHARGRQAYIYLYVLE